MPVKFFDERSGLTQKRLKEIIRYNPFTGDLLRKESNKLKRSKGLIVQTVGSHRYPVVTIDGKRFLSHRVIWFYMTGKWPRCLIDHADGNRSNNKWLNLREATYGQNRTNVGMYKNNTTGVKGITFNKVTKRYVARINLGAYDSLEEAKKVRREAELRIYGEFAK